MGNEVTLESAGELVGRILRGGTRRAILAEFVQAKNPVAGLQRLRESMRSAQFRAGSETFQLGPLIRNFDSQVPGVGFHVLKDWDGKADKLNEEIIAVDMATYFIGLSRDAYSQEIAAPVILDYYFCYILAVLALNSWQDGDPNANLDRVTALLAELQSAEGSGHHFAANAETLILIATSHFEPDESAYRQLLANVNALDESHRVRVALSHGAILGSHLRHGFQDLYKRDFMIMRDDNGPDYPWLFFSVATLMKAYVRMKEQGVHGSERQHVLESLINGLTADARALIGKAPPALSGYETDHAEFCALFYKYRQDLLEELETLRPNDQQYSPLAFNFNFPHNVVKGLVANAIVRGLGAPLPFNDLLTGFPHTPELEKVRRSLIRDLVEQARSSPDIIRERPVPIFSHDPYRAIRIFTNTMGILRTSVPLL